MRPPSWGRCQEHLGPHGDGLAAQWTFKEAVEEGYWGCLMSVFKAILALACFGPTLTAIFPALETTYVNEHYFGNQLHGLGVTLFPLAAIGITFVWYIGDHA